MAEFVAGMHTARAPGEAFRYSSGDSNLLSAALKGMLGHKAYMSYPWDALFKPLGIHNATWEPMPMKPSSPRPTPTSPPATWRASAC